MSLEDGAQLRLLQEIDIVEGVYEHKEKGRSCICPTSVTFFEDDIGYRDSAHQRSSEVHILHGTFWMYASSQLVEESDVYNGRVREELSRLSSALASAYS